MLQMKLEEMKRSKQQIKVSDSSDKKNVKANINLALARMGTAFGLKGPQLHQPAKKEKFTSPQPKPMAKILESVQTPVSGDTK